MGSNIILATGAMVIFATFQGSSNRLMTVNSEIAERNEYYITALALAQSIIDEAKTKAFDEQTISRNVPTPAALTYLLGTDSLKEHFLGWDTLNTRAPYSSLNPSYISSLRFNDVDDYNNYRRIVNTTRTEDYRIRVRVNYTSVINPDSVSIWPTFCKRMTVVVRSKFFPDSVQASYAFFY